MQSGEGLFGPKNSTLPVDIVHYIVRLLKAGDLLSISMISKRWKKHCKESKEYNKRWWQICMDEWFEEGQAPKRVTAKDLKKDWKEAFFRHGRKGLSGPWITSIEDQTFRNRLALKIKRGEIRPLNWNPFEDEDDDKEEENVSENKKAPWMKEGLTHDEWRSWYKEAKNKKPKWKKPSRDVKLTREVQFLLEADC